MASIKFNNAQFMLSSPNLELCPPETGREIAFAGRSNAGKSSAINRLTGNGKLARTSKTPGRTQLLNFFALDSEAKYRLVDLPGYGYAKVPQKTKLEWQQNMSEYLYQRKTLVGLVLLMDIRHPMQEFDSMMINWAVDANMQVHALLTKSDKLKRGAAQSTCLKLRSQLKQAAVDDLVSVQTFSSLKGEGVDSLSTKLESWLLAGEDAEEDEQLKR